MIIYELTEGEQITELKAAGHVDPHEFQQQAKQQSGIDVNLGDVKHCWDCMRVVKNVITFPRCTKHQWGANPVTIASLK